MDEDIDKYLPHWRQRLEEEASALTQRRQAAEEAARRMARILVQEFAAERVYLIGSLADRERFGSPPPPPNLSHLKGSRGYLPYPLKPSSVPLDQTKQERIFCLPSPSLSLRFRHLFRNIYGFELRWNRIEELGHGLTEILYALRQDIERFLGFLTSMQENL